jgi:hypothetical protein
MNLAQLYDHYPDDVGRCEDCKRIMLPQKLWWHLRRRGELPDDVVRINARGNCITCDSRDRRASRR